MIQKREMMTKLLLTPIPSARKKMKRSLTSFKLSQWAVRWVLIEVPASQYRQKLLATGTKRRISRRQWYQRLMQ